jgi:hypothetical protein
MFLSGDEKAKPVVAQLIRDAGSRKRQPRDPQQGEDPGDGGKRAGSPRHPRRVRQHPGYRASFSDAGAAAADMRRRFKFLGDRGVWRLLTSASRDIG